MLEGQFIKPADAFRAGQFARMLHEVDQQRRQRRFWSLVAQMERPQLEMAVETMIADLDRRDGDVDLEPDTDREPDDDAQGDQSWAEWHTRGRHKLEAGGFERSRRADGWTCTEDDEDDDPAEDDDSDCCTAGDDRIMSGAAISFGANLDLAVFDIGDEHDAEHDHCHLGAVTYREPDQSQPLSHGRPFPGYPQYPTA